MSEFNEMERWGLNDLQRERRGLVAKMRMAEDMDDTRERMVLLGQYITLHKVITARLLNDPVWLS